MTVRMFNGRGAEFFANIAKALEDKTCILTKFPGAVLPNAHHVSTWKARHCKQVGRPWLMYLARRITKYNLMIKKPLLLHQYKVGILSAFQKPLEDKVLNTLFNQKVLQVDQAFRLGHGGYIFLTDRVAEGVVGI
ncbi:hypothetical protein FB639_003630, partial [Coemansia asiatica]